nr:TetR family transcriptional regulator [uncultured Clostridium sp.]
MGTQGNDIRLAILEAGKQEFLKYGYEGASLRRIAREACVTTGAIYGYFPGKDALFEELTGDAADGLMEEYRKMHVDFAALPPEKQAAALDVENESLIQSAISNLIRSKTVLIIAHRMRTVAQADKIVVLKDGRVAEEGSPEALYKKGGIYRHMTDLQNQSQNWSIG